MYKIDLISLYGISQSKYELTKNFFITNSLTKECRNSCIGCSFECELDCVGIEL